MVRIHSLGGDRVSYVTRPPFRVLFCSFPSSWHGPQFQVLRVEMFCFSSSKISINASPFLPESTTRGVCREGGPETEFATAGT
jgi:hypothetical protein